MVEFAPPSGARGLEVDSNQTARYSGTPLSERPECTAPGSAKR
jgi:hypothetical protein